MQESCSRNLICEKRSIMAWLWTDIEDYEMVISAPPSIHWDSVSGNWTKWSSLMQTTQSRNTGTMQFWNKGVDQSLRHPCSFLCVLNMICIRRSMKDFHSVPNLTQVCVEGSSPVWTRPSVSIRRVEKVYNPRCYIHFAIIHSVLANHWPVCVQRDFNRFNYLKKDNFHQIAEKTLRLSV